MKIVELSQGKVAWVDDADFPEVSKFKWHYHKDKTYGGYASRNVRNPDGTRTRQFLHHFLMPGVKRVDHKDGNRLNDCRDNLRPCTRSQNMWNSCKSAVGTSNFKGVGWNVASGKWRARIKVAGTNYWLGCFTSEEDAARAYDTAARKFHGEFARLNLP